VLDRQAEQIEHADVSRLPGFLAAGDLLVVNDTKVFPARLLGSRVPSGREARLRITRANVGPPAKRGLYPIAAGFQRWETVH
jgi:S-adenosylmethionine:tRNA-ribosyltransferase-isomerase (queuine synthetase)